MHGQEMAPKVKMGSKTTHQQPAISSFFKPAATVAPVCVGIGEPEAHLVSSGDDTPFHQTLRDCEGDLPCHREYETHGNQPKAFGLQDFRPGQLGVVTHIASGAPCLVLMPTGGGKSLCFQLPALLGRGVSLVVCPLLALIQDQVSSLQARGLPAATLNSSLRVSERSSVCFLIHERSHL